MINQAVTNVRSNASFQFGSDIARNSQVVVQSGESSAHTDRSVISLLSLIHI